MSILLTLVILYAAICLFVMWSEPRMIYYPSRALDATPDRVDLQYEDVWLTASDGVKIHGWYLPAASATEVAGPLLFLHGNGGNISHRLEKFVLLHQLGLSTLAIDYRGYGQSEGAANERGTYADAEAALAWLEHRKQRAAPPAPPLLYGESLGSAIAVELATRHPVAGVILEEPLASVAAIGQQVFPFLPVRWLVRNRYDSLSKIGRVKAPLLIFHSPDDEVIPYRHGQQLFAAAREPKTFVNLQGGHNDAFARSWPAYRQALEAFLATLPDHR